MRTDGGRRRKAEQALIAALATGAAVLGAGSGAEAATSAKPLKIVQLGDSYSAGNGAGNYYGPKDCYRSTTSYARRWVTALSAGHNVTFVNRACSGSILSDVVGRHAMDDSDVVVFAPAGTDRDSAAALKLAQDTGRCASPYRDDETFSLEPKSAEPEGGGTRIVFTCHRSMNPQWDAVDPSADIVLLTIGGNDLFFSDIVRQCFLIGDRNPAQCKEKVDDANRILPGLGVRITDFLRGLKAKMRADARIVLLAYPYLEKDEDLTLGRSYLGLGTVYEVGRGVRGLGRAGDTAQKAAVDTINGEPGPRITYVDRIKSLFAGHEPDGRTCCRNDARWIHEFDTFTPLEYYHFNQIGHDRIGALLAGLGDFSAGHAPVGASGIDVVFAIDTTGSMGDSIDSVKETAKELVSDISAQTTSARFALIDYRDFASRTGDSGDYPGRLDADFTADGAAVATRIEGLTLGYGGDTPETMFSALHTAYGLTWRPGVKKLVVVLADAPPLSPEPISGLTAEQITKESLAIDPVEVHVVDVGSAGNSTMLAMAKATNGGVYDSSDAGAAEQIAGAVRKSVGQPYAWAGGPYVARVGDTVALDGSGSYGVGADIVQWAWDLDDDGTADVTSSTPTLTHRFGAAFDGQVRLTVTDAEGRTGLSTAVTRITDDGDEVPRADDNCPDVANAGQTDEDQDGAGDECDPTPGFRTTDLEGVYETSVATAPQAPAVPGTPAAPPAAAAPGGPIPPAAGGGASTAKPTVRGKRANVTLGAVRVTRDRRHVTIRLTCRNSKGSCRGRLTATVGTSPLRARTYKVKAGRTATLSLTLSKTLRSRLGKRAQAFSVRVLTSSGAKATRKVTLARVRARR